MSKLEIISPDSSLRKQIESAIKPKITLTKKQKPKIIIFEDDKPVKKTKKIKAKADNGSNTTTTWVINTCTGKPRNKSKILFSIH